MSLGVAAVAAWNPDDLRTTADGLDRLADRLDDRFHGLISDQDALAEQWTGTAANTAAIRVVRERSLAGSIAEALLHVAEVYRTGAWLVGHARTHLLSTVNSAEQQEFTLHDNGIVDASSQVTLLRVLLPPGATRDNAHLRLERDAAALSVAVVDALEQVNRAALDASDRTNAAITALEDAGRAAIPGRVAQSEGGEFSLRPDWPATVAASTIGLMVDSTKEGLRNAAIASGDDFAAGMARRLGPVGAALGVVPAIANDILGAATSIATSKLLQWAWD